MVVSLNTFEVIFSSLLKLMIEPIGIFAAENVKLDFLDSLSNASASLFSV